MNLNMNLDFEFATAKQILFKTNGIMDIAKSILKLGKYPLVVTGKDKGRAKPLLDALSHASMNYVLYTIHGEPTTTDLIQGVEIAKDSKCDMVIGFGGGSVLDSAKAIAILMNNPGELMDYLEVIGKGLPMENPSAPLILIPTTSGTGSEVTKNSVVTSQEEKIKVSLRSPSMLADLVLVDPSLTLSMPQAITASTGLDALTQVIEPYVSSFANPLTDGFCREGIWRIGRSIKKAYDDGLDITAREDMALGSLLGGMALANAKLGAVHGFAGVIGGKLGAPHGFVCAALLPSVIEYNIRALIERDPEHIALRRYQEISIWLTGDDHADISACVHWLKDLYQHMNIQGLAAFGITTKDFDDIIRKSSGSSSMKGNPITLTHEEMINILTESM